MNEIIVHKEIELVKRYDLKNLSPDLSNLEQQIINSRNCETLKQIKQRDDNLFNSLMMQVFLFAMKLSGKGKDGEKYEDQIFNFSKQIAKDIINGQFGSITYPELEIAIARGCKEDYGEFYGINYTTITKFIKAYLLEQNGAIAKQRIYENKVNLAREEQEKSEQLRREFEENIDSMIESDIEEKKKNPKKYFQDIGSVHYKHLVKIGRIKLTKEEIEELKEKAIQAYKSEQMEERKNRRNIWKVATEESERSAKNRLFAKIAYNDWLENQMFV